MLTKEDNLTRELVSQSLKVVPLVIQIVSDPSLLIRRGAWHLQLDNLPDVDTGKGRSQPVRLQLILSACVQEVGEKSLVLFLESD